MKILILSPYYFPYINPRAHRWTSIAEYWAKEGHEVHLICSKNKDFPQTERLNEVHTHRTGFNSLKEVLYHFSKNENKRGKANQKEVNTGKKGKWMQWFNDKLLRNLYFPDDAFTWYHPAKKKAKELLQNGSFDLLISSSVPFTTHLVALKMKEKYPNLKWIADTGDPFAFQPLHPLNNYFLYGNLNKKLEEKVAKNADFITLTNIGASKLYSAIFPEQQEKFKVIPPIYNQRQASQKPSSEATVHRPPSTVRMAYFGSFFKNIREPRPMLQFWTNFLEKYPESQETLELHFFGNIFENFLTDFAAFPNLEKHIFIHGMLSKEAAMQEMQNMDFLLNVGNKTTFQLPSKSTDYLASGKAIINFCSIKEDTFAVFFDDYDLIINVLEKDKLGLDKINNFLKNNLGKQIGEKQREKALERYNTKTIAAAYLNLLLRRNDD